jgi:hypothetical protein
VELYNNSPIRSIGTDFVVISNLQCIALQEFAFGFIRLERVLLNWAIWVELGSRRGDDRLTVVFLALLFCDGNI